MIITAAFLSRLLVRSLLVLLFVGMGLFHLVRPQVFGTVMPPFIPFPSFCIWVSGLAEILGGVGLLVPVRWVALLTRWGLVLLLLAVFPVNIYMALYPHASPLIHIAPWILWARLPLQPLLIWAVIWMTRLPSCRDAI